MSKASQRMRQIQAAVGAVWARLPVMVGAVIVSHTKGNWRKQGFERGMGQVLAWAPRKGGTHARPGAAILVKTGRLRRSIRVLRKGSGYVVVGTDVPYAAIHNEGRGRMPERRFLGASEAMAKKCRKVIRAELLKQLSKR